MSRKLMHVVLVALMAGLLPGHAPVSQGADGDDDTLLGSPLLTRETERAIERGLEDLKKRQADDGSFSDKNSVGVSALALIAYMTNAHFPGEGDYAAVMDRGLDFLLRESQRGMSGYMGTNMYSHGLATLALSELWGHTEKDDQVREAIKQGVDIILQSQNRAGGWRYNPEPAGADVSVTAMQLVALASARQAGILVPDETIDKAIRYIKMCHDPEEGGFSYYPEGNSGWQRTGAAVVSLMLAGEHDAREVKAGLKYMHDEAEKIFASRSAHREYGYYYSVIAMYLSGQKDMDEWYPQLRNRLLEDERKDGGWGKTYTTSMYVIVLSMPRGFVPAYQR